MGYFTQQVTVVPIDTDDVATAADKVTIRRLTYEERQRCISLAMKVTTETQLQKGRKGKGGAAAKVVEDQTADVVIDGALMAAEQVAACLVSWEGPGFEGRPATRENLFALPPEIVDKISAAADQLNQGLSEQEKN